MGVSRKDRPHFARWGGFAKVGSKRKGGGKTQRTGGVKTQMGFFDKTKLEKVALTRGYYNLRAIADGLVPVFELSSKKIQNKLNSGRLTKEECEVIGAFFEMTMKEFYDVFMNGLFQPTVTGHYVCHIDHMKEHMKPPEPEEEKPKRKPRSRKDKIQAIIDEINEI